MHSGTVLSELENEHDKLEYFLQLSEHLNALKEDSLDLSLVNLNPSSIIKSGNIQIILSDFMLPVN